jgi:hypothetical protein
MNSADHETALRRDVLLTLQVALLGAVDPHLRGVTVTWDDHRVDAILLYDGVLGDLEEETASAVEGEVIAGFPKHEVSVTAGRCDAPAELNAMGLKAWAYRRRESPTIPLTARFHTPR